MSRALKYAGKYPTLCGCCRGRASNIGYTPHDRRPIMWLCEESKCIQAGEKVYHMKDTAFIPCEARAVDAAVEAGGMYLEDIARADTPLTAMTPEEYRAFVERIIDSHRLALQKELTTLNAPY